MRNQKEDEEYNLDKLQENKAELKQKLDEIIAEIENTQNIGFESKTKIEQINSDINISKEKISNNNINVRRYENEVTELETRIGELEEEKRNRIEKKDNLSVNKEKFENELKQKEEELAELTKKLSSKELEIEEKKKKVEENTNLKYERQNDINSYDINFENLEKRQKTLKQDTQLIISELDAARLEKQEISKGFLDIDNVRNKAISKLDETKTKKEEAIAKIKEFDEKINRLSDKYRIKNSKLKFLQETEKEKEWIHEERKIFIVSM